MNSATMSGALSFFEPVVLRFRSSDLEHVRRLHPGPKALQPKDPKTLRPSKPSRP